MTYKDLANKKLLEQGLKIEVAYIENSNYSKYAIYLNRIANAGKPKFRVLTTEDDVKNCIKITFNPDMYERGYLVHMIKSKLPLFAHLSHGSCHSTINKRTVAEIITGIVGRNGLPTPEAKEELKAYNTI